MESKIMLDDVLQTVKNMTTNYAYALNEASSEFIYKEFLAQFQALSMLAKELYNLSYDLGWVNLTEASTKDIKKEKDKEQTILESM